MSIKKDNEILARLYMESSELGEFMSRIPEQPLNSKGAYRSRREWEDERYDRLKDLVKNGMSEEEAYEYLDNTMEDYDGPEDDTVVDF